MRQIFLSCFMIILLCLPAAAIELAVGEGLTLNLTLPDGWTLHTVPPEPLIAETAEHVAHEASALGKQPSPAQIREVARKRLAANEAIIYHAASGAHLDIDFSRLEEGEAPPSSRILKKSAEFAVDSLEGEEGVSAVDDRVTTAKVAGADEAYRLDASYKHHEDSVSFIGIIGYTARHWFFLYFTAPGQDPQALEQIEQLLDSLTIVAKPL